MGGGVLFFGESLFKYKENANWIEYKFHWPRKVIFALNMLDLDENYFIILSSPCTFIEFLLNLIIAFLIF